MKLPGMKSILAAPLQALVGAAGSASSCNQHTDNLASLVDAAKL